MDSNIDIERDHLLDYLSQYSLPSIPLLYPKSIGWSGGFRRFDGI